MATSFPLFPFLPAELQQQIWHEAVNNWSSTLIYHHGDLPFMNEEDFIANLKLCSLMRACHLSRKFVLGTLSNNDDEAMWNARHDMELQLVVAFRRWLNLEQWSILRY